MKRFTDYITLKFISILLISIILMMTSVQIFSMLKIKSDVLIIQTSWDEVQIEQSKKLRLESSLHRLLGLSGIIHQFKDTLLTKNLAQIGNIKADLHSAETILSLYLSLQLNSEERYALHDIISVIKEYQKKITQLPDLIEKSIEQENLYQYMGINDEPAIQGLAILKAHNRRLYNQDHHGVIHFASSTKSTLLADVISLFGYGGLIHHIKNFQINKDNQDAINAQNNINEITLALQKIQNLVTKESEKQAIDALKSVTNSFQIFLDKLKLPIAYQESIDSDFLMVNESAEAFDILQQHVEADLKYKILEVDENIHHIQDDINNLISVIIFLNISTLLFLAYIMFNKVINPLRMVTFYMVLLARKRQKNDVHFNTHQIFEIKQMMRSIRIFKRNELKRQNNSKSLKTMNEKALQQLSEIKMLQSNSEQKTQQAMSLATHLIDLQKSAESDRNFAQENQRRVNTILNTVHDAIITTNKNGIIENINTATENMLGFRSSELIGNNISLLIPDNQVKNQQQHIFNNLLKPKNAKTQSLETQSPDDDQSIQRSDGSTFPVEIFLGQSEFNNEINFTAVIRDITQRKKDEQAIQHLVLTDPLTDLANRRHFNQALQHALENQSRLNLSVGLLMIDLDNFKPINDTYGHHIGDRVLERVSSRIKKITRSVDLIARLGGDEFAIILNNVNEQFSPCLPAQKIIDSLSKPMDIDGKIIKIGATIGIAIAPQDATDMGKLINRADKALYKAKSLGKGQYFSYIAQENKQ